MSMRRRLIATGLTAALVATMGSSAWADTSDSTTSETPTIIGIPPQTAQIDIARVLPLSPRVHPLMVRTADADGALGHDAEAGRERFSLSGDVFFEDDAADLTSRAQEELARIVAQLIEAQPESVQVVGHTDSVGTVAHNDELSQARAAEVEQFLTQELDGVTVETEGRGSRELIAEESGTDEEVARARSLNRRVEITATYAAD